MFANPKYLLFNKEVYEHYYDFSPENKQIIINRLFKTTQ
jgi:hypothetical protein